MLNTDEEGIRKNRESACNRRRNDARHQKKLKRLAELPYYIGVHYDEQKGCYFKSYRGSRSQACKRFSNRKVRHYQGTLPTPSAYQKLFDFWWEIC